MTIDHYISVMSLKENSVILFPYVYLLTLASTSMILCFITSELVKMAIDMYILVYSGKKRQNEREWLKGILIEGIYTLTNKRIQGKITTSRNGRYQYIKDLSLSYTVCK